MRIQAYLTAAAINLKRLAAALLSILSALWPRPHPRSSRAQRHPDLIPIRFVAVAEFAAT
jgi:hypothetical protein